ncbi:cold-shock protein [Candidatus Scalindua japonica]|uniref:cold-shock protein n=1 Tax=Candidatus Scalindua japonica TaxID=1284222 RepID=UPI000BDF4F50|nr:cold shock domain-containing protein [Candidatus Scalindua japonica]
MIKGTVSWFNDTKGIGYISRSKGDDVFVHDSAIQCEGFKTLSAGNKVEFEIIKGKKGYEASKVFVSL